jgi:hypothetical protein
MSGELLLSIGVGLAVVFCGLLGYWGALRSFTRKIDTEDGEQE